MKKGREIHEISCFMCRAYHVGRLSETGQGRQLSCLGGYLLAIRNYAVGPSNRLVGHI